MQSNGTRDDGSRDLLFVPFDARNDASTAMPLQSRFRRHLARQKGRSCYNESLREVETQSECLGPASMKKQFSRFRLPARSKTEEQRIHKLRPLAAS